MSKSFINDEIPNNLSLPDAIEWYNHLSGNISISSFLKEAINPRIKEQMQKLINLYPNIIEEVDAEKEARLKDRVEGLREKAELEGRKKER